MEGVSEVPRRTVPGRWGEGGPLAAGAVWEAEQRSDGRPRCLTPLYREDSHRKSLLTRKWCEVVSFHHI